MTVVHSTADIRKPLSLAHFLKYVKIWTGVILPAQQHILLVAGSQGLKAVYCLYSVIGLEGIVNG